MCYVPYMYFNCARAICVRRIQAEEDVAKSERHAAQHPRRHSVPRADPLLERASPGARCVLCCVPLCVRAYLPMPESQFSIVQLSQSRAGWTKAIVIGRHAHGDQVRSFSQSRSRSNLARSDLERYY